MVFSTNDLHYRIVIIISVNHFCCDLAKTYGYILARYKENSYYAWIYWSSPFGISNFIQSLLLCDAKLLSIIIRLSENKLPRYWNNLLKIIFFSINECDYSFNSDFEYDNKLSINLYRNEKTIYNNSIHT